MDSPRCARKSRALGENVLFLFLDRNSASSSLVWMSFTSIMHRSYFCNIFSPNALSLAGHPAISKKVDSHSVDFLSFLSNLFYNF